MKFSENYIAISKWQQTKNRILIVLKRMKKKTCTCLMFGYFQVQTVLKINIQMSDPATYDREIVYVVLYSSLIHLKSYTMNRMKHKIVIIFIYFFKSFEL